MFDQVGEFHEKVLLLEKPTDVSLESPEWIIERTRFLLEEVTEFTETGMTSNIVGAADALADIVYVALGTAWQMGLPFNAIWDLVQAANMKKRRGMTKRGNLVDAVKPLEWVGPEAGIAALILRKIDETDS